MLVGVGVDLLHLARLRAVCSRRSHARVASRILSTAELDDYAELGESTAEKDRFLALRWAAKEAAYKALFPTCGPTWKDLAVRKAGPKPLLAWADDARASLSPHSALKMHLTVSHDNDQLVAFVVVEKEPHSAMRDRYDDDPGDDSAGYDDEKGGGGGASYADDQQPPFDPSKNYRFRHEAVFLCTTVTVCVLDLLVAGFISYEHFGVEAYVWGIAVAVSVIESLFIGGSVALIEFHVGTHKHWDMVIPQAFIWAGSLTINIVFLLGAMGNKADSPKMFIFIAFLVAASQLSGLALAIVGSRTHILLLEDPNPEKHGFHPKGEKKRHHWGRRHKHGRKGRDDDDDA